MIARKAKIYLKLMAAISPLMPLPKNSAKAISRTKFRKGFGLIRQLYTYAFLICVGIMIASDVHVYRGDIFIAQIHIKAAVLI